jgi:hypothetical protein
VADFRIVSSQLHLSYIEEEETFALDPGGLGLRRLFTRGGSFVRLGLRDVLPRFRDERTVTP